MNKKKIVHLVCPSCRESYNEKETVFTLDPVAGKLTSKEVTRKQCPQCRSGLVRQVVKYDKKGKIKI